MEDGTYSPLFEGIGAWLVEQGLRDASISDVLQGFCERLVKGGVSLHRVSLGSMVLHPVFGALDVVWHAQSGNVTCQFVNRQSMTTEGFRNTPFFWAGTTQTPFRCFDLTQTGSDPDFPVFDQLRTNKVTDYALLFEGFHRHGKPRWSEVPEGFEGVFLSLSTKRLNGFSEFELHQIKALMKPLALAIKSATTYLLAAELLDTYLGSYTGRRVLDGAIERGDGGSLDCVLFYCDLRGSSRLAEDLGIDTYLGFINQYFDCTAGAVSDHGGEVLKFIGDAVMAIFPVNTSTRPVGDMCRAAMTAANEAFARAQRCNQADDTVAQIDFGVALHVGRVMYGNVGTDRRLDFTTIGPAVNEVARLEGLCKQLGVGLVASDGFATAFDGDLASLGAMPLAGIDHEIEVFTLPEMATKPKAAENQAK